MKLASPIYAMFRLPTITETTVATYRGNRTDDGRSSTPNPPQPQVKQTRREARAIARANRTQPRHQPWTTEAIDQLATVYADGGFAAARDAFPHRSEEALRSQIREHGMQTSVDGRVRAVKRWEPGCPLREAILRELGQRPLDQITQDLGVNVGIAYKALLSRGLINAQVIGSWDRHETDYLRKHIGDRSINEIAYELSRDPQSVKRQLRLLKQDNASTPTPRKATQPGM